VTAWADQQEAMVAGESRKHAEAYRKRFVAQRDLALRMVRDEIKTQRQVLDSLRRGYERLRAEYLRIPCTREQEWQDVGPAPIWNELLEAARVPAVWDRLVDTFDTREASL
jgi:hypothetical protein